MPMFFLYIIQLFGMKTGIEYVPFVVIFILKLLHPLKFGNLRIRVCSYPLFAMFSVTN